MVTLLIVLVGLISGADGACVSAPVDAVVEPPENPWIEPARDVLVQACGSCHRPDLPTSNPRALAVFDLQDQIWYGTMTDDQLRSLGRRIQGSSKVEDRDRDVVNMFVNCKLTGACSDARPQESP